MKLTRLVRSLVAVLLVATPVTHGFAQRTQRAQRFFGDLSLRALREYLGDSSDAQQQPAKKPVFRGNTQIISVDVIVRDGSGAVVKGMTQNDFEILEDGKAQEIRSFAFEEITDKAQPGMATAELLAGAEAKLAEDLKRAQPTPAAAPPQPDSEAAKPMTSDELAGRR